jgi:hypothetical protein
MPRSASAVWDNFLTLCESGGKKHVTCSYCNAQYKHATANKLREHLFKCKKCPNNVKNKFVSDVFFKFPFYVLCVQTVLLVMKNKLFPFLCVSLNNETNHVILICL